MENIKIILQLKRVLTISLVSILCIFILTAILGAILGAILLNYSIEKPEELSNLKNYIPHAINAIKYALMICILSFQISVPILAKRLEKRWVLWLCISLLGISLLGPIGMLITYYYMGKFVNKAVIDSQTQYPTNRAFSNISADSISNKEIVIDSENSLIKTNSRIARINQLNGWKRLLEL